MYIMPNMQIALPVDLQSSALWLCLGCPYIYEAKNTKLHAWIIRSFNHVTWNWNSVLLPTFSKIQTAIQCYLLSSWMPLYIWQPLTGRINTEYCRLVIMTLLVQKMSIIYLSYQYMQCIISLWYRNKAQQSPIPHIITVAGRSISFVITRVYCTGQWRNGQQSKLTSTHFTHKYLTASETLVNITSPGYYKRVCVCSQNVQSL